MNALVRSFAALLLTAVTLGTPPALADMTPQAPASCPAATAEQARWLADVLYDQREFRRAAVCYETAGDPTHANAAFTQALARDGRDTQRRASEQADQAKALLHKVTHALQGDR